LDSVKVLLRAYHDGDYIQDLAAVFSVAESYVDSRARGAKNPAVVLDIDETSLSNWENLDLNDFGFIKKGPCSERPGFSCGFDNWIAKAHAIPLEPARHFFNSMRAKHIAVFFVTGRRDSQRSATVRNLHRAGFNGWTKLVTRPDDDKAESIVPFKSGERAKIAKNYTILATIGDQESDGAGAYAHCGFKLPNPFYAIP
jgi:acid phosphatase